MALCSSMYSGDIKCVMVATPCVLDWENSVSLRLRTKQSRDDHNAGGERVQHRGSDPCE
jgi:hypothetical protein